MHNTVISGTGLFRPPYSISNAELVEAFNAYVHRFNAEHAAGRYLMMTPSLGGTGIYDYVANAVAPDYDIVGQVVTQATAVGLTMLWSAVVALVCYKAADILIGLRVSEDEEREGLDIASHGESAYHY